MAKTTQTPAGNGDSTIHLTLQGKGGVGKSLVAAILAQFFKNSGRDVSCIDTDPVNRTFAQYAALGADRLQLRDEHNRIDQRSFDVLMERFLTQDGATFVVDNGASTFLPLWHYLLENNALDYLRGNGRKVFVHTVITGGQALVDTLNGFHELAQTTQERNIVVWVNEYFGRVEADGKKLTEMAAFRDNAEKVCGAVVLAKRNQDTFGRDLEEMIAAKLTFQEAINDGKLPIMAKQRLKAGSARHFRAARKDGVLRGPGMDATEIKRLAAEVSVQHGIRIDPDDPIMAVVTLNRLVLEATLADGVASVRKMAAELNDAAARLQVRAGSTVAQEVRECVAAIRSELQRDIGQARSGAAQLEELQRSQSRWSKVRWIAARPDERCRFIRRRICSQPFDEVIWK